MANSSSCFQVHGAGFTRTTAHTMLQKNYFLNGLFKTVGSPLQFNPFGVTLQFYIFILLFFYYKCDFKWPSIDKVACQIHNSIPWSWKLKLNLKELEIHVFVFYFQWRVFQKRDLHIFSFRNKKLTESNTFYVGKLTLTQHF